MTLDAVIFCCRLLSQQVFAETEENLQSLPVSTDMNVGHSEHEAAA
jgi:hypothetical protein